MLSRYARTECFAIAVMAVLLAAACAVLGLWWLMALPLAGGAAALFFYRDPKRFSPKDRNVAVSPADGKISSIHEVAYFEPFGGPAVCVRVFLSISDVHVNYCPAHATVHAISRKPGAYLSALNPRSVEANESVTTVFHHPTHKAPLLAVRQIASLLTRTVFCALNEGQVVQRGAKLGIIKLGSTVELYLPVGLDQVLVREGQRVVGAVTPLAVLPAKPAAHDPAAEGSSAPAALIAEEEETAPTEEDFAPATAGLSLAPETDADEPAAVSLDIPAIKLPVAPPPDVRPLAASVGMDTAVISGILDDDDNELSAKSSPDLTDHAISQVMDEDASQVSQSLTASHDGEFLTARMENAGTDLMLHPAEHGEDENQNLAESLAGLRPEADTSDDEALLQNALPEIRQPGADSLEDSGGWQIVPTSKKAKKPKADGLLWEEAP